MLGVADKKIVDTVLTKSTGVKTAALKLDRILFLQAAHIKFDLICR